MYCVTKDEPGFASSLVPLLGQGSSVWCCLLFQIQGKRLQQSSIRLEEWGTAQADGYPVIPTPKDCLDKSHNLSNSRKHLQNKWNPLCKHWPRDPSYEHGSAVLFWIEHLPGQQGLSLSFISWRSQKASSAASAPVRPKFNSSRALMISSRVFAQV